MDNSITAEKREIFGKKLRIARGEGKLPAVLYGPKEKPTSLFVNLRNFKKMWKEVGETTVISIETPNGKKDALIHNVDFDPVSDEPIHADFYAIEAGKEIQVHVPLVFEGVSPAVKELGGTLVKVIHELEVEGQPKDVPHEIIIDISNLVDFESHIKVGDIKLPEGVKTVDEEDEIVASISAPREEEEEEEPVDISEIKVEKKGKKEDEEEAPEVKGSES